MSILSTVLSLFLLGNLAQAANFSVNYYFMETGVTITCQCSNWISKCSLREEKECFNKWGIRKDGTFISEKKEIEAVKKAPITTAPINFAELQKNQCDLNFVKDQYRGEVDMTKENMGDNAWLLDLNAVKNLDELNKRLKDAEGILSFRRLQLKLADKALKKGLSKENRSQIWGGVKGVFSFGKGTAKRVAELERERAEYEEHYNNVKKMQSESLRLGEEIRYVEEAVLQLELMVKECESIKKVSVSSSTESKIQVTKVHTREALNASEEQIRKAREIIAADLQERTAHLARSQATARAAVSGGGSASAEAEASATVAPIETRPAPPAEVK